MSNDGISQPLDTDPFTEQAAERLENGVQDAIGSLTIDMAEVRESIQNAPEIVEAMEQAQYCLNRAKDMAADRGDP